MPESNVPSVAVAVCATVSLFVQVTVVPAAIPISAGWNAKSRISTVQAAPVGDAAGDAFADASDVADGLAVGDAPGDGVAEAAAGHGVEAAVLCGVANELTPIASKAMLTAIMKYRMRVTKHLLRRSRFEMRTEPTLAGNA